ncbi:cytochrome P450 [Pseudomaricurvus alcaniphilus]|uniref:cytochrome P450 n=1 Tax=Pseudomaricurvus alcaniphilus TaxID=1166482 RepID=UPI00140BE107|nr:cytochrome P450 [Pseudomaricurvus alcaniphilus]NHN39898.1 cytochrome P450 [Pseudomaricurvus alcaniphilus]
MAKSVPVIDDITLADLYENPYPIYARLRREAPIAWIPAANIHLVTRFDTIKHIDTTPAEFPANDPRSLQIRAMGHTMMRKDGDAHRAERSVFNKALTPDVIKNHWAPRFAHIVNGLINDLKDKGEADLFSDFAAPMASQCLMELLGLTNVRWDDLCDWSQTLMDAVGNYGNDLELWARQEKVSYLIDQALDEMIHSKRANPDLSLISMLANTPHISLEQIRANVKVIIGGGINEPRDATCTSLHGLLSDPEQLKLVKDNPTPDLWANVFEETIRYCAPIGMYPRRVADNLELDGYLLKKNDQLGLCVASACHDEKYWSDGDRFDITRKRNIHLAFGTGPHICLGFRIARMQVGQLSVPSLLKKLPGLRLDPIKDCSFGGWVFRGPLSLPVKWDA